MRLELPKSIERFGAVRFGELQKVFELDSGLDRKEDEPGHAAIRQIPYPELAGVESQMAIVLPVRNERLKLVEGVLCGIPHPCLIVIVSNSPRAPVDRFRMEKDALRDFCTFAGKNALIAHQKDPLLARAFERAGYTSILTETGAIRDGKAEGMLIGTMLARLAGKKFVGFVDSDNYFPGAVHEYISSYAAGFAISRSPYCMVRIAWHSKPKIVEAKLFFRKWGRTSATTNRILNRLLSHYTGFETEVIKTGNAGEHAMSMDLAVNLDYSSGYSIEPYHIVNLVEKFGGIKESPLPEVMQRGIEVYQIESRNPHLHETGDQEHIDSMRYVAMQVIYHSDVCPKALRKELLHEMVEAGYLSRNRRPPRPASFPAISSIDEGAFLEDLGPAPYAKLIREGIGLETR